MVPLQLLYYSHIYIIYIHQRRIIYLNIGSNSQDKLESSKTKKPNTDHKSMSHGKDSKLKQFIHNFLSLSSNRTTLLPLILSVMVVSVGVTYYHMI